MTTDDIAEYFRVLSQEVADGSDNAEKLVRYDVDMEFKPVTLVANKRVCDDICILTFDEKVPVQAGEFIFLWVPGISYYAVSLVGYLAYPLAEVVGMTKGALSALITLPVVGAVWYLVHRIRRSME